MRAPERGILRRLSVPKSISNKCSIAWRCTLKVCSPQWHALGPRQNGLAGGDSAADVANKVLK
jgi:hypothetical protein